MNTTISNVSLTKLLTIGAALALLLLIVGGAVAERAQHRAASDRFFLGELGYGQGAYGQGAYGQGAYGQSAPATRIAGKS